jgi:hypothetical protein
MQHRHGHRENSSGETGHTLELDCLYPQNDTRRQIINRIDHTKIKYKTLAVAILESMEQNPAGYTGNELWDPPAGWMRDVHYAVVNELRLEDWRNLAVMPTLKTAADMYHGIDFLFIYREPSSEREIIVTVDLSLREKDSFKADVLVTDTRAIPNPTYYKTAPVSIPDEEHATREEEQIISAEQRKQIGVVVARIIQEKLIAEDPHYGTTMKKISGQIQRDVASLMSLNHR